MDPLKVFQISVESVCSLITSKRFLYWNLPLVFLKWSEFVPSYHVIYQRNNTRLDIFIGRILNEYHAWVNIKKGAGGGISMPPQIVFNPSLYEVRTARLKESFWQFLALLQVTVAEFRLPSPERDHIWMFIRFLQNTLAAYVSLDHLPWTLALPARCLWCC